MGLAVNRPTLAAAAPLHPTVFAISGGRCVSVRAAAPPRQRSSRPPPRNRGLPPQNRRRGPPPRLRDDEGDDGQGGYGGGPPGRRGPPTRHQGRAPPRGSAGRPPPREQSGRGPPADMARSPLALRQEVDMVGACNILIPFFDSVVSKQSSTSRHPSPRGTHQPWWSLLLLAMMLVNYCWLYGFTEYTGTNHWKRWR